MSSVSNTRARVSGVANTHACVSGVSDTPACVSGVSNTRACVAGVSGSCVGVCNTRVGVSDQALQKPGPGTYVCLALAWVSHVGVSHTHVGVSNTCVGVSNTRVGVSNTRAGVSDQAQEKLGPGTYVCLALARGCLTRV